MSVHAVRRYLSEPPLYAWFEVPSNLATLYRWLDERGQAPEDVAYYMDKPWHWENEWQEMVAQLEFADE